MEWSSAKQGTNGFWFKAARDAQGRRHLLMAETRAGVDGGSHDHYWEDGRGGYGVQLRDRSGTSSVADKKGHIFPHNSSMPSSTNEWYKQLFDTYCP